MMNKQYLYFLTALLAFATLSCVTTKPPEGFERKFRKNELQMELFDLTLRKYNKQDLKWKDYSDLLRILNEMDSLIQNEIYDYINPLPVWDRDEFSKVYILGSFNSSKGNSPLQAQFVIPEIEGYTKKHEIYASDSVKTYNDLSELAKQFLHKGGYIENGTNHYHFFPNKNSRNQRYPGLIIMTEFEEIDTLGRTVNKRWYNPEQSNSDNKTRYFRTFFIQFDGDASRIDLQGMGAKKILRDLYKKIESAPRNLPGEIASSKIGKDYSDWGIPFFVGVVEYKKDPGVPIGIVTNTRLNIYDHLFEAGLLEGLVKLKMRYDEE